MLKKTKALLARRFRNSQRGQTVVLMAFGFIALIAFIGLVTDISILFIRYSTLRRAVDAAALAAAGQIREGTEYGTVALAARQYIALHNLKPHSVWVETCETDIAAWRKDNPEPKSLDLMPKTELCDWDNPKKLVRVKAQIDSETTFLKIIGIENFIITSSATSETAVLDVALVLDTSRSMGDKGTNMDVHYPYVSTAPRTECQGNAKDGYGGCCNDPGTNAFVTLIGTDWTIYTDNNGNKKYDAGDTIGITNPAADGDKSDLVCHPFKQVKDAARNFIRGLDFTRGDRVALITFDRDGQVQYPNDNDDKTSATYAPPMMANEDTAIDTLNKYVGIDVNKNGRETGCDAVRVADENAAAAAATDTATGPAVPINTDTHLVPWTYGMLAHCTNTNVGDGIRRANEVLTNVETIRREAVWVAIILSDGAANAGWVRPDDELFLNQDQGFAVPGDELGALGFCPWSTFCKYRDGSSYANLIPEVGKPDEQPYMVDVDGDDIVDDYNSWNGKIPGGIPGSEQYPGNYPDCSLSISAATNIQPGEPANQYCNDMNPSTRHKCLEWRNGPGNGLPANLIDPSDICWTAYDADDYARDMADWAGLVEVAPKVPGNFIAMFAIGFGDEISNPAETAYTIAAPLLRYIADAGDNGQIDNTSDRAWRGLPPGTGDVCEGIVDPTTWCGQYYYADNLESLNQVFEDIASRLFTRLSR